MFQLLLIPPFFHFFLNARCLAGEAEDKGLRQGDKVLEINGVCVRNSTHQEAGRIVSGMIIYSSTHIRTYNSFTLQYEAFQVSIITAGWSCVKYQMDSDLIY